jgi:hypothetical protein
VLACTVALTGCAFGGRKNLRGIVSDESRRSKSMLNGRWNGTRSALRG